MYYYYSFSNKIWNHILLISFKCTNTGLSVIFIYIMLTNDWYLTAVIETNKATKLKFKF